MKRFMISCLMLIVFSPAVVAEEAIINYGAIHHPVIGQTGMVVSQREIASVVGAEILAEGGNAVDAAVATGLALAVVLPRAGNIGGGGFMLIYLAETNEVIALDYREAAPAAATRDMYLDGVGNVDNQLARYSLRSSGVPGTIAGFAYALEHYGTMSLRSLIEPAIRLADKGFIVSWDLHENLRSRQKRLGKDAATREVFYPDGQAPVAGSTIKQKDLAWTLKQIRRHGADGFYKGRVAEKLVSFMEQGNGLITLDDLENYQVAQRAPVRGTYRGYEIVSMPPTSSGGVHVIQMLNILENFPMGDYGYGSHQSVHLLTESMRLAYADRSEYLGDPDFFDVPVGFLTDKQYAARLSDTIKWKARPSSEVSPGTPMPEESPDTTHYSVMDKAGNAVANTYTLNFSYGSGIMVPGAGFLLNNEMDDFSAKPGVPNAFGLIGGEANAIEAGKRPLSSMTPTMIMKDGKPWVVTGSPGGSKIITSVLQLLVNMMDHDMNIAEATAVPRIHHQWLPDRLLLEPGFSPDTIKLLQDFGHDIQSSSTLGSLQSIEYRDGYFFGAADPRRPGAGAVAP